MIGRSTVNVSTEEIEDFEALYAELRGIKGIEVITVFSPIEPGDQGSVIEFLTVSCASGGAVAILLDIVKTLLDSRGPKFVLKVRSGTTRLEITAESFDEGQRILRELLNGS